MSLIPISAYPSALAAYRAAIVEICTMPDDVRRDTEAIEFSVQEHTGQVVYAVKWRQSTSNERLRLLNQCDQAFIQFVKEHRDGEVDV